jgi:hypothetical protein
MFTRLNRTGLRKAFLLGKNQIYFRINIYKRLCNHKSQNPKLHKICNRLDFKMPVLVGLLGEWSCELKAVS